MDDERWMNKNEKKTMTGLEKKYFVLGNYNNNHHKSNPPPESTKYTGITTHPNENLSSTTTTTTTYLSHVVSPVNKL